VLLIVIPWDGFGHKVLALWPLWSHGCWLAVGFGEVGAIIEIELILEADDFGF